MNQELEICVCGNDKASHYYDMVTKERAACLCANCDCKKYEKKQVEK